MFKLILSQECITLNMRENLKLKILINYFQKRERTKSCKIRFVLNMKVHFQFKQNRKITHTQKNPVNFFLIIS